MTQQASDTRPPEPLADTLRRIRSTTWLTAGAAAAASAVMGIVFAQSAPTPAAAEPLTTQAPLPATEPERTSAHASPIPAVPRASAVPHHHAARVHTQPLRPPAQPPIPATSQARAISGAS